MPESKGDIHQGNISGSNLTFEQETKGVMDIFKKASQPGKVEQAADDMESFMKKLKSDK